MPFAPEGGQHEAIFQRHEPDDLGNRVAPRDHHQHAEQDDGQREGKIFAAPAR